MSEDLEKETSLMEGPVPVLPELYLAMKDFNPDLKERGTHLASLLLGFRTGELILMTVKPNRGGWFEGYRHNDP